MMTQLAIHEPMSHGLVLEITEKPKIPHPWFTEEWVHVRILNGLYSATSHAYGAGGADWVLRLEILPNDT